MTVAETSGIAWTKSTMNFWIGCTKVSTEQAGGGGCDGCYAEHATPSRTMKIKWGAGEPRHRTKPQLWNQLDRWNREARTSEFAGIPGFWPVFIDSLSDFFDNEVEPQWRADAWAKIKANPNLTFLIVTKRIGNAKRMLPEDWGDGYPNVWIIATVVNQTEADRDIPKLLALPAAVHGVSVEPQLGLIDLTGYLRSNPDGIRRAATCSVGIECRHGYDVCPTCDGDPPTRLDWVICGGESDQPGHPAREFMLDWAGLLAGECVGAGVAFFMKQLGHKPTLAGIPYKATGKGEDPAGWPPFLRRREFPKVAA